MSRYGLPLPDGSVEIVSLDDGLDAPWCDSSACYLHGPGDLEHHVEGCYVYGTFAQASHRLDDELRPAIAAIKAELSKTAEGRLAIRYIDTRAWIVVRVRRARWRLGYWRRRIIG